MTKKELIKYLQSKENERISELKKEYDEKITQVKKEIMEKSKLKELADTISEQCESLLELYDKYIEDSPYNTPKSHYYYGSYPPRECLVRLTEKRLEYNIMNHVGLGDDIVSKIENEHRAMVSEVHTTYTKLKNLVKDSVRAKDAAEYLKEVGFDMNIVLDNKSTPEINTDILFGKKEN